MKKKKKINRRSISNRFTDMDSQPIICNYCKQKTHSIEYCDKYAINNHKPVPHTVRIRLPLRSEWSFNNSRYLPVKEGDSHYSHEYQFTIAQGSLRILGYPAVYIRLRDTSGNMMETVWVAGIFSNGERYATIQGCLFNRTKQKEFSRVSIRTRNYVTVDVRANDMLRDPIDIWVLGAYYKLLWLGPKQVLTIPRDDALFLVEYFSRRPNRRNFQTNLPLMPSTPNVPNNQVVKYEEEEGAVGGTVVQEEVVKDTKEADNHSEASEDDSYFDYFEKMWIVKRRGKLWQPKANVNAEEEGDNK